MKLPEPDQEEKQELMKEERENILQKPAMTKMLLGIIVFLLICILVLLLLMFTQSRLKPQDLQQNITDYAKQQELSEQKLSEQNFAEQDPEELYTGAGKPLDTQLELTEDAAEELEETIVAVDDEKAAIVVDIENESDESYTKEFILKEAYPHFEANNQDAIWDLAHLKRYVKLSKGLEGTGDFYYQGDVDSEGKPDGTGLAIYEKNSYYFGQWSHGVRSGKGAWFRYYINQKNKTNAMGTYMSHSYSGFWANNLPNGEGAEHYDVDISTLIPDKGRIIQNVVGNFKDGLYDGDMYANTVNYIGNVEEWDGVATEGVFTLWRDMSAIGECAVWRYRDDHSVCLDIDKSENKNQGIRELLK